MSDASEFKLEQVSVDKISPNKDNPRIVFRPGELEELLESIRIHGIQVPISVYKDGGSYVLIDGERRWRCSLKLNKKSIPALVQKKPDALGNLLLMFNIHSLREQWDLLTIALKLPAVISLLKKKLGDVPSEKEISEQTGLARSVIRRCKLLMELPDEFQKEILTELNKPKGQQRITEDFFIELERSLKTVERAIPGVIPDKSKVRRLLIDKYKAGVVTSKLQLRKIAKIARSENVGVSKETAEVELTKLFADASYSIDDAYEKSVAQAYTDRDVLTVTTSLIKSFKELEPDDIDDEARTALIELRGQIDRLVEE